MNAKINCCYHCEKRYGGCHAECEEYKEASEEWAKHKEKVQAAKNREDAMEGYIKKRDSRVKKHFKESRGRWK